MADEKKDLKGDDKGGKGDASKAAATEKKKGNGYFAHVQLIHGETVIPLGEELPEDFPSRLMDRLVNLKHVAKERPPYSGSNVPIDKGTPIESMRDAEIKREKN